MIKTEISDEVMTLCIMTLRENPSPQHTHIHTYTPPSSNTDTPELLIRQKKRLLHSGAVLLAVDDPKPNIGSGSAALNALLCVSEHLAANEGLKVIQIQILI